MTALPALLAVSPESLPALIAGAVTRLANARTSAEVLEARDFAGFAYDVAKSTARLLAAKKAHDELMDVADHAMADALLIESRAKIRLADEYDEAQKQGRVRGHGGHRKGKLANGELASAKDIGLSHHEVHTARQIRDAEEADPGIVERTLNGRIDKGLQPTRTAIRKAVAPKPEESTTDGIIPRRRGPYITGDSAVHHAIDDACRVIEPLGEARAAMRRYPPQLAHCVSIEKLRFMSEWFAAAADEWKRLKEPACPA